MIALGSKYLNPTMWIYYTGATFLLGGFVVWSLIAAIRFVLIEHETFPIYLSIMLIAVPLPYVFPLFASVCSCRFRLMRSLGPFMLGVASYVFMTGL